MKPNKLLMMLGLALASVAIAAPQIESARIDNVIKQMRQQAPQLAAENTPPAVLRKQVETQLQSIEVLKAEALKVGLDKQADIHWQWKNLETQFYAAKYVEYLEQQIKVDEAQLRVAYDLENRVIKLQQVRFATVQEAKQAQELLLKGLSFEELMKRYPNSDQDMPSMVNAQQLPPEIGAVAKNMARGEVTREPVAFNGEYYLLKIAAAERNPEAQPFEQMREHLIQQAKQHQVQEEVNRLLRANGVQPPQ